MDVQLDRISFVRILNMLYYENLIAQCLAPAPFIACVVLSNTVIAQLHQNIS